MRDNFDGKDGKKRQFFEIVLAFEIIILNEKVEQQYMLKNMSHSWVLIAYSVNDSKNI